MTGILFLTMHIVYHGMHCYFWKMVLVSFPPLDSIAKIVARFKSISASEIFRQFPEVKRELWKGAFWEVGYFARTVGSDVTAETIRKYIEYHGVTETTPKDQLELF